MLGAEPHHDGPISTLWASPCLSRQWGGHGLFVVIGWVDVVEREGWGSWSVCALLRLCGLYHM